MTRPGDRSLFPELGDVVYFNHAAVSPPSAAVRAAVLAAVDVYARLGAGAVPAAMQQRRALKARLAARVGARPEDLALVPSTTRGLIDLALCLPWRAGDRVVLYAGEFPTNVTPWQAAAQAFGLAVEWLPVRPDPADLLADLERVLRRGVRLVAVSAVQFQTGLRMPVEAMARLAHAHGAELACDAMQAVGMVPFTVGSADYVVCGSHKWLMGVEGCGFVYAAPGRAEALVPRVAGWLSHEDPARFLFEPDQLRYDRPIRAGVDRLEVGAANTLGCAAWEAAVALLDEVGEAAIWAHGQALLDALEAGLVARGFQSLRAPDPAARSGILSVRPPSRTVAEWAAALAAQGVVVSTPDGLLRWSPHWPNDAGQVARALETVDRLLR